MWAKSWSHHKRALVGIMLSSTLFAFGCSKSSSPSATSSPLPDGRHLYVASGACYSGNNTTFSGTTSSNMIYAISLSNGQRAGTIADYFATPANVGDSPAAIVDNDGSSFFALIENATTPTLRRIEKVAKALDGARSLVSSNTTALSAQLRSIFMYPNGDFIISKSTAIEYISAANARIGAPFINATAAPCATSTTLISKLATLNNGEIVFLHAAAGQNRIGIFSAAGGTTCASAQLAPNVNSYPSAAFYDGANNILVVAYAGNATTTDLNSIYAYKINESTNTFSSPQKIYDASLYPTTYPYLLYGVSEMAFDPQTQSVYVATAVSTATTVTNYAIEKFYYDYTQLGVSNSKVLTRATSIVPYYPYGNDTKCISKMMITN